MSAHQNYSEVGWMYIAPNMPKDSKAMKPFRVPPISNIPCIGLSPDDLVPPPQPQVHILSTDTPYIRLCKEGGRQNLLTFKENVFPKDNPGKPYARVDWFYTEDWNAQEEYQKSTGAETKQHMVRQPYYMVHSSKPNPIPPFTGPRWRQRLYKVEEYPLAMSVARWKTENGIKIPPEEETMSWKNTRHGLENNKANERDKNESILKVYAKDYEMIRKEYRNKYLSEGDEKAKKFKFDPFEGRSKSSKGSGGNAKKPKQVIGGW